jgi:tRNA nucleotidyltransferase (CCA-adding enzyme)
MAIIVIPMTSTLQKVCTTVLHRVTPRPEERRQVLALAEELSQKVKRAAENTGVDAEVRVEGSVAKDTWLSEEPDIDIFMRVPTTMSRNMFGTTALDIARKATAGFRQIERFAEHPYLEAVVNDVRINIVPCYKVEQGQWSSATDRTPFHTDYMKPLLGKETRGEVRLLKKFMKGVGVYGAEIKVGGFSGYLCELLILDGKAFIAVLKSFADWKRRRVIDFEGHYDGIEDEVPKIFAEPLVVVDPVDKGRNAAAAVRAERLDQFVVAARAFLNKPRLEFFSPKPTEALKPKGLVNALKRRGSTLVFLKLGKVQAVPDVLWGQLYKSQRSLRRMLEHHDFNIIRDTVWSDPENFTVFILEVEQPYLAPIRKHLGPPLRKRDECERFLQKHVEAAQTIAGPYVEDGRWAVEMKRKHTDIVNLLLDKLEGGGRSLGVAELVSQALVKDLEILVSEDIRELYSTSPEFAAFLTEYLDGKPAWLDKAQNT